MIQEEVIDKRKLKAVNTLLEFINTNFISLKDNDIKKYGAEFRAILGCIIEKMKQNDEAFSDFYERNFFAGSYWDGLKVGKPTEFDVDIVIKLPLKFKKVEIQQSRRPGFVRVKITPLFPQSRTLPLKKKKNKTYRKGPPNYRKSWLKSLLDSDGYLLQTKFRAWMESTINKALNSFYKVESNCWKLSHENFRGETYLVKLEKSGPAMTLIASLSNGLEINIDLVPVIEFRCPIWSPLEPHLMKYGRNHNTWYIVPKPHKNAVNADDLNTSWRTSFNAQERTIMNSRGVMKPVCRLLKKLRDSLGLLRLSSYYIKTLILWEIVKRPRNNQFFHNNLSYLFIYMLQVLRDALKCGKINYFWDSRHNLLEGFGELELENDFNRINKVLEDIKEKAETDYLVFARWLLTTDEFNSLPDEIKLL